MVSATWAQTEEIAAPGPLNETKPAEVRIVSTEFGYAPAKVMVIAGRAMTLVLDNSGGETEHDLVVPAFGFRLQANAGETARKSTVFEKPGEYEYSCDLPGHRDAGMKGTPMAVHKILANATMQIIDSLQNRRVELDQFAGQFI
jgi:uncharacterized cupredoxin-like copper-binding protein